MVAAIIFYLGVCSGNSQTAEQTAVHENSLCGASYHTGVWSRREKEYREMDKRQREGKLESLKAR